jgi:hypothetical protein
VKNLRLDIEATIQHNTEHQYDKVHDLTHQEEEEYQDFAGNSYQTAFQ